MRNNDSLFLFCQAFLATMRNRVHSVWKWKDRWPFGQTWDKLLLLFFSTSTFSGYRFSNFRNYSQPQFKHLCSNIFPDLFLDKNPKIAIWFIFLCTTCFDHQALFTCCYWLDSFDSWLSKSKSEAFIKTQTDTKIGEKKWRLDYLQIFSNKKPT